jgi:hypothetical protein
MPLIVSIIAKALAFADAFLGAFATVNPVPGTLPGVDANCGVLYIYNVEITNCGTAVAAALAGLTDVGLVALSQILGGVLAV